MDPGSKHAPGTFFRRRHAPMTTVRDWRELEAISPEEGKVVLVAATNLRYKVMCGRWIVVGTGPG
jgi:hypothetical protein